MTARGLAHILFRHKRKAGLVLLTCLMAGVAAVLLWPPSYQARTTVLFSSAEGASAQAGLFAGPALQSAALEAVGHQILYPGLGEGEAREAFAQALQVRPRGSAVELSFTHGDPELAAQALNALTLMQTQRFEARREGAGVPQMAARASSLEQRLHEAQQRLAAWRQEHRIYDLAEQRQSLMREQTQLDTQLAAARVEAGQAQDQVALLRRQIETTPATVPQAARGSAVAEDARRKLFELRAEEQKLLGSYTPTSQFVTAVRAQIEQVERVLREEEAAARANAAPNPLYQQLRGDLIRAETTLATAERRAREVSARLDQLAARIDALSAREAELAALEREVQEAEAAYEAATGRSARALAALGEAGMADPALPPSSPIRTPWVIFALALLGGVVGAVVTAALAELLTPRLATPAAVERRLGLPVLTSIAYER
ncbi:hypothetical protein [Telmatospirillum sp. J64-1]|uniref:GumC family protein n=1 Tax=Telmatospirillum sp. J64-1 TaxID=2502183 RepID=UPI00115EFAEE|nr:hypothetical protein [Telmatospirillum sp. J64-1]